MARTASPLPAAAGLKVIAPVATAAQPKAAAASDEWEEIEMEELGSGNLSGSKLAAPQPVSVPLRGVPPLSFCLAAMAGLSLPPCLPACPQRATHAAVTTPAVAPMALSLPPPDTVLPAVCSRYVHGTADFIGSCAFGCYALFLHPVDKGLSLSPA